MRTYTKRIMELTIILTVLLVGITHWHEWRRGRAQISNSKAYALTLNQALWDKYGPGSKQAYFDLFQHAGTHPPRESPPWKAAAEAARVVGFERGLIGVQEAPEWFQSRLRGVNIAETDLRAVLDKGPFVAAPDEVYFASAELGTLDFLGTQRAALALRLLAGRDWLRGDHAAAIEHLTTIMRLGDAFQVSLDLIAQLIRAAIYGIGLDGLDDLTWTDPSPQDNRCILRLLESLNAPAWRIPCHTESMIWMLAWGADFWKQVPLNPESFAAAFLLYSAEANLGDEITRSVLRECGIFPKHPLTVGQISNRLGKWTTLPAMRRGAQLISDTYFETDELLSATAARTFPPLAYLASRCQPADYFGNARRRFGVASHRAAALLGAYRARCWRDEHGAWPNAEEFAALVPKSTSLQWHIVSASAPLLKQFMAIHGILEGNLLSDTLNRNRCIGYLNEPKLICIGKPTAESDEEERGVERYSVFLSRPHESLPAPLIRTMTPSTYYIVESKKLPDSDATMLYPIPRYPADKVASSLIGEVTPTRAGVSLWARAAFQAFQPLVISATEVNPPPEMSLSRFPAYQRMSVGCYRQSVSAHPAAGHPHVVVGLRLPKRSYWVTHPGPDGVADGPALVYNPSNGTLSRGDIVQLAGWDW